MSREEVLIQGGEEHHGEAYLLNVGFQLLDFLLPKRTTVEGVEQVSPFTRNALVSGPPQSGKTSLLLQLAYNLAIDTRAKVVFICKPENFENDYIFLCRDLDISCEATERIHIKYMKDDEELSKYFAAFHLHSVLPTAVIIDGFVDFFRGWAERNKSRYHQSVPELPLVKALSLCHNAVQFAHEKDESGLQCRLVISDTHLGDEPRLLFIFKRWLSEIFVIKALDAPSAFTLQLQDDTRNRTVDVLARFALGQQILYFNGLERRPIPVEVLPEQIS